MKTQFAAWSSKLSFALLVWFALATMSFAQTPFFVTNLQSPTSITVTGGGADLDISSKTGFCVATLISSNTAGSSPTLAAKLQHAALDTAGAGPMYLTAGSTDNKLKAGATTTVLLAASFTSDTAIKSVKLLRLQLKKIGTITAGKKVTVAIQTNNSGVPSGTQVGSSTTLDIDTTITTSYSLVQASFTNPVDLAAETIYWIVLSADYTASTSNCVTWRTKGSLSSGGNFATQDGTNYTADATSSAEFFIERQYLAFADVASGAAASATTGVSVLNKINVLQQDLNQYVRGYYTIGGTSNPAYTVSGVFVGGQKSNP